MPYTYILKTKSGYYVGSTDNLSRRFRQHRNGEVKWTKGRLPVELVYAEEFENTSQARRQEFRIKKWKSKKLIESLIKKTQPTQGPIV